MIKEKRKIMISAYACEPHMGSEVGVGWHWVLEMSKHYSLWVLTRMSNKKNIEEWISQHPEYQCIRFIYFDLPDWLKFWKKGMRGVRLYYNIWTILSNRLIRDTMKSNHITIFHHLTYGNSLWPVSRYGQNQYFIWGPTGGVDIIPREFSREYDLKGRIVECARRMAVKTLKYNVGFNRRCKNADLILCKTEYMRLSVPERYRNKALVFTDVAADAYEPRGANGNNLSKEYVEYLTVGKLDPWRGFDLLIEAFSIALQKNSNIRLQIIGDGFDKKRLNKMIMDRELQDYITMVGKVNIDEYFIRMKNADVIVNASLKEGAVTTSFDAMAYGKPLICIDTMGYTRNFSDDFSIIIRRTRREEIIQNIANAILELTDENKRKIMGCSAQIASSRLTWEHKGAEIHNLLESVLGKN